MKILHLITWVTTGGIEHWLIDFALSNRCRDISMSVCCRKKDMGALAYQLTDAGIFVESCPMLPNLHSYERRLATVIKRSGADLIHNHLGATSLLAVKAANQCRVPVITTFHSPQFLPQTRITRLPLVRQCRSWYTQKSIQYAIDHSKIVTGVSRGVLKAIVPDHSAEKKFRVTYLGIPQRQQQVDCNFNIKAEFGWAEQSKLIFKLGRIAAEKCPLDCLEIFRRVLEKVPEARLVFLGDGLLRNQVRSVAKNYGIDAKIALLGYREDAPQLLQQADLLLQPSLYEGFGLAAAEAASAGVPTVASDIPGLNEAVQNNRTGLLYPKGDVDAMASGVIKLLTDSSMYHSFSERARCYANKHFSSTSCQSQMIELYREVLTPTSQSPHKTYGNA